MASLKSQESHPGARFPYRAEAWRPTKNNSAADDPDYRIQPAPTKEFARPECADRMRAYLATICRDLGSEAFRTNGVSDHVHIVTTLPRTLSQAQMIERIKKASSKWIKPLEPRYRDFFWQRGYAAVSVSPSQLEAVLQYLQRQREHHRTRTFQEEYRELLNKHGIKFDERYVWD